MEIVPKFEFINTVKYACWSVGQFVEQMKLFHKARAIKLIAQLKEEGLGSTETFEQIEQKNGPAYEIFMRFNAVGGKDFYQETITGLAFIDFLGHEEVQEIGFPVKLDCPADVDLVGLEPYIENRSGYDFVIKKNNEYICFQLKSMPEKWRGVFNADCFIKDIKEQIAKYADEKMVLVYLLQPSLERNTPKAQELFYEMIERICQGIGTDLKARNIFLVGRLDLETYEYIQLLHEVVRHQVQTKDTLAFQIRSHKPFSSN